MKKKVLSVLGIMVISFIGVFSLEINKANADTSTGWGHFATEDGKWDGRITTNSMDPNVVVRVSNLWKTDGYGANQAYPSNLQVRLCNAYTGACTGWKYYEDDGSARFYGMKAATFNVDMKDIFSWLYIYGDRVITAY
ncbi:hypothetical protein LIT32_06660 [Bacillus sp. CMF21]|uniref:hypothetical protein n=1 Tax=Metabacillus dongyingensis TaxID=2874282 RepID=UPI001CC087AF|nr:hypothetical protein [Metabacillus dongyingensis]UAL53464.1 hypothetical protein K8L98_06655 [Metabacillus dongyingensis]UOK58955.1 hypothetical protein MGI18_08085 [Bacillus sp. OVS6]USK29788.1 hypothetical protein LIT32_06660 [Bacillus sp. CMF21]